MGSSVLGVSVDRALRAALLWSEEHIVAEVRFDSGEPVVYPDPTSAKPLWLFPESLVARCVDAAAQLMATG
ncbi:MAG: hypothetical protein FJW38_05905 [Acidobacteria bacterium]|nr:hypothetical protein [Acidobacteriota bacterium]